MQESKKVKISTAAASAATMWMFMEGSSLDAAVLVVVLEEEEVIWEVERRRSRRFLSLEENVVEDVPTNHEAEVKVKEKTMVKTFAFQKGE